MSLNQQVIAEFSPCTPSAPQLRDLSIQTFRPGEITFRLVTETGWMAMDSLTRSND